MIKHDDAAFQTSADAVVSDDRICLRAVDGDSSETGALDVAPLEMEAALDNVHGGAIIVAAELPDLDVHDPSRRRPECERAGAMRLTAGSRGLRATTVMRHSISER